MNATELNKQTQAPHCANPPLQDGQVTGDPARPAKLLRLPAVEERTACSRASIYAWVRDGSFPAPVHLSPHSSARAVAWRQADVDQWIDSRVSSRAK